jgi:hypothetical protein
MATTTPTTKTKATAPRDFGEYHDLLTGLSVARGEQARLATLLDEIAAWTSGENSICRRVAVYTGRVRGPLAIEAIKRTRRRKTLVMRLLPSKRMYRRRLEAGTPVLVVEAAARVTVPTPPDQDDKVRHERRCQLFRRTG